MTKRTRNTRRSAKGDRVASATPPDGRAMERTRGRHSIYGQPMRQIPVGLSCEQLDLLAALVQHERSRGALTSQSGVIRNALVWYARYYESEHGVKLADVVKGLKEGTQRR